MKERKGRKVEEKTVSCSVTVHNRVLHTRTHEKGDNGALGSLLLVFFSPTYKLSYASNRKRKRKPTNQSPNGVALRTTGYALATLFPTSSNQSPLT